MSSYSFNARIGSHARGPVVVCGLGWPDVGMAGVKHLVGRLFPQFHLAQVSIAGGSQSLWATRLRLGAARLLDKWCLTPFIAAETGGMRRILLAAALSAFIAGCERDEKFTNVGPNGEVETPSAPVEQIEDIPPHKRFKNVQEACPPLPVKDGFVTVKMKVLQKDGGLKPGAGGPHKFDGEITLRLPEYARITRSPAMYGECEYARRIDIPYTWYKGKLFPGQGARFDIPSDYDRRVDVSASPEKMGLLKDYKPADTWRYALAIPHKYFPLVYYPRYRWETEAGLNFRSSDEGLWGVLHTKHHSLDGKSFVTGCTIKKPNIQTGRKNPPIETQMSDYGDSHCGGRVVFEKNGKVVTFGIRNWKDTVPEINHIYDAVYEEVQRFVQ